MPIDFKNIHIGRLIKEKIDESGLDDQRICSFMKCTSEEIREIYREASLPSDVLLKFCKLLDYDFFRLYSHHLILYSPAGRMSEKNKTGRKSILPEFRKSLYTKEIIDFILELEVSGKKTKNEIMEEYRIPKTTLYKWIEKYGRKK